LQRPAGTPIATLPGMLGIARKLSAVLLPLLGLFGCGSDQEFTADAAGVYTVAITNQDSSCQFMDWVPGKETSGIELTITQDVDNLHGSLGGITGLFFAAAFGSADFSGSIHGNSLTLTNYGTRSTTQGNCTFTYNATVNGTQTMDAISGTITYSTQTNGNPDCEAVKCSALQKFSGTRPPK
jgi:hypothetical protein